MLNSIYIDPIIIAAVVLAFLAGYFLGRLFSTSCIGSLFIILIGVAVLAAVIYYLVRGELEIANRITENLAYYVYYDFAAFVGFLIGLFLGIRRRSRRSRD